MAAKTPARLPGLKSAALVLAWVALSASCARAGHEEPLPGPASGVGLLPADCVFALRCDLESLRKDFARTDFAALLVTPEYQAFLTRPLLQLGMSYLSWRQRFPFLPHPALLPLLASSEVCVGLRLAEPAPGGRLPRPQLCLALRLNGPAARLAMRKGVLERFPSRHLASGEEVRDCGRYQLALVQDWLLAAKGQGALAEMIQAVRQPKTARSLVHHSEWQDFARHAGSDSPLLAWASLKPLHEHLLQLPCGDEARAAQAPSPAKVFAALGLDGVHSLGLGLQIRDGRFDFRIALEAPSNPAAGLIRRGLLKVLQGEGGLEAGFLQHVPAEADWFYATRLNLAQLPALAAEALRFAEGDDELSTRLGLLARAFGSLSGFDLKTDLLGLLGDQWLLSDAGGGGAFLDLLPPLVVTGTTSDGVRLEQVLLKLLATCAREAPPNLSAELRTLPLGELKIHYLSLARTDLSPAFSVWNGHLVCSTTVAALRRQCGFLAQESGGIPDIRANRQFQEAFQGAFGRALLRPPSPEAGHEPLPLALRFLAPGAARPTRTLGLLLGAAQLFGPNLPRQLRLREGFQHMRRRVALQLFAEGLKRILADRAAAAGALPADPGEILAKAGKGAAESVDLSGVTYRSGLSGALPPRTVVAYTILTTGWESTWAVLRMDGSIEELKAFAAEELVEQQRLDFIGQGRPVRDLTGPAALQERPGNWWLTPWGVQAAERHELYADLLRLLESFDFALLPDPAVFEALLQPGLSWTECDEWGLVTRTQTGYPLPAADLTGVLVPAVWACISFPELVRAWRTDHEAQALQACQSVVVAQSLYRLVDWDRDGILEYAPTLEELRARGLLDPEMAKAELREGARPLPSQGYYFRMLPAQGPHAPGGPKEFAEGGHWVHGFALLAWPARYGKSGRKSLLTGAQGVVFENDLLPVSDGEARAMRASDPDERRGWRRTGLSGSER